MDESRVTIEYQLTEAEYLAATKLYFFNARNVIGRMIVTCLLALVAAAMISVIMLADVFILIAIVFVLAFEIWIFHNVLIGAPRRFFRNEKKFHGRFVVTFSDEGLATKTAEIDSKVSWNLYTKVVEGSEMYLLFYGTDTRMMTTVPKRAFKSSDDENRFRQLVSRHIPDHSGLKNMPPVERDYTPKSLTPPDWR